MENFSKLNKIQKKFFLWFVNSQEAGAVINEANIECLNFNKSIALLKEARGLSEVGEKVKKEILNIFV